MKVKYMLRRYLQLKHPVISKLDSEKIKNLIGTLYELGYPRDILLEEPSLCSFLPITLKYRYSVLQECGLHHISSQHLASYLNIVKRKNIGELKANGIIPTTLNIENRLASYMTQWPTSLTTLVYGGINIKEVLRMHPKLAMVNCSTMIETRKVLEEYEEVLLIMKYLKKHQEIG
ncbi:unnamed protein product, partial [Brenthis ino]